MNKTEKEEFIKKLRKDKENAYLRNLEKWEEKKKIRVISNVTLRKSNKKTEQGPSQNTDDSRNTQKSGNSLNDNNELKTNDINQNMKILEYKTPDSLPKIKLVTENVNLRKPKTKLIKKQKSKNKAVFTSKPNYNTEKSRLRRARLTQEEKAVIREKDKIRKRECRANKTILKISDMSKKQKKIQRRKWRETKKEYRRKKKSLNSVINTTPPNSDSENSLAEMDENLETPDIDLITSNTNKEEIEIQTSENHKQPPFSTLNTSVSTRSNSLCTPSTSFSTPCAFQKTDSESTNDTPKIKMSYQKINARKHKHNKLRDLYREIERMKHTLAERQKQIEDLKREKLKYKKRLERQEKKKLPNNIITQNRTLENAQDGTEKNQASTLESPNTKIITFLNGRIIPGDVKRELVFGAALKEQIVTNFTKIEPSNKKNKQIARQLLSGNILKKYKLHNKINRILPYRENRNLIKSTKDLKLKRKNRSNAIHQETKNKIRLFFESDRISKMCPGKANFITKKKVKKQKRLLLFSLASCFKKFKFEFPNILIGFTTFYHNKPFWVVQPKTKDRETCACVKHENFKYIVAKLFFEKVTNHQNLEEIAKGNYKLVLHKENESDTINLFQWKSQQQERKIGVLTKLIRTTSKKSLIITKLELMELFLKELPSFKLHSDTMNHQMEFMEKVKSGLVPSEMAIQIDFAENYYAKLETEIQSMHFGASKRQISIHTGVAYFKNHFDENKTISFATLSDNIDHQAPAIWCHMKPVLSILAENIKSTSIKKIYMFSDGPTSQYKNKFNIYLAANNLQKQFPNADVSWNYSASGHGKGPMDGIGGTIKRLADRTVLRGNDITCAGDFINLVRPECKKTYLFEVSSENIQTEKENSLQNKFSPIKKITQAHQITWGKVTNKVSIYTRSLSCYICPFDEECSHFFIDKQPKPGHVDSGTNATPTSSSRILFLFL